MHKQTKNGPTAAVTLLCSWAYKLGSHCMATFRWSNCVYLLELDLGTTPTYRSTILREAFEGPPARNPCLGKSSEFSCMLKLELELELEVELELGTEPGTRARNRAGARTRPVARPRARARTGGIFGDVGVHLEL